MRRMCTVIILRERPRRVQLFESGARQKSLPSLTTVASSGLQSKTCRANWKEMAKIVQMSLCYGVPDAFCNNVELL